MIMDEILRRTIGLYRIKLEDLVHNFIVHIYGNETNQCISVSLLYRISNKITCTASSELFAIDYNKYRFTSYIFVCFCFCTGKTDHISLFILFLIFLLGRRSSKRLRPYRFKSDRNEI